MERRIDSMYYQQYQCQKYIEYKGDIHVDLCLFLFLTNIIGHGARTSAVRLNVRAIVYARKTEQAWAYGEPDPYRVALLAVSTTTRESKR